ncbi:MAG: YbaN family protein [Candidatus Aminicenantes bacterium]|nr:YbaN family protein [Candidatus Aminicenantes bacterium]
MIKKTKKLHLSRACLVGLGFFFVGLGFLGIFLPLLPTTPFLLLAAGLFARSSPRFYNWLLNHKWLGSYIRNYREKKGIPLKTRIITIIILWIVIAHSAFFIVTNPIWRLVLILIACGVSLHVATLSNKNPSPNS